MRFGANHSCDGLKSSPEGPTAFPDGHYGVQFEIELPKSYLTEPMITGTAQPPETFGKPVLYIQGCFAYRTFEKERVSAYCFFLFPQWDLPIAQWDFRACTDGNRAT